MHLAHLEQASWQLLMGAAPSGDPALEVGAPPPRAQCPQWICMPPTSRLPAAAVPALAPAHHSSPQQALELSYKSFTWNGRQRALMQQTMQHGPGDAEKVVL